MCWSSTRRRTAVVLIPTRWREQTDVCSTNTWEHGSFTSRQLLVFPAQVDASTRLSPAEHPFNVLLNLVIVLGCASCSSSPNMQVTGWTGWFLSSRPCFLSGGIPAVISVYLLLLLPDCCCELKTHLPALLKSSPLPIFSPLPSVPDLWTTGKHQIYVKHTCGCVFMCRYGSQGDYSWKASLLLSLSNVILGSFEPRRLNLKSSQLLRLILKESTTIRNNGENLLHANAA